ncbi:uncharacterized protein METZ01_LOCUS77664, partial [marine metagenome]
VTPEQERVRNYLIGQGRKYSFRELWKRMIKARLQLIDEVENTTQTQADFAYDSKEWTISEVAHHVVLSTESVARVVESLSIGKNPDASGVEPSRIGADSGIEVLRDRILGGAVRWSAMTERLPDNPDLSFTARHDFFGELHAPAWYLFQRVHDLDHLNQIKSVKEQKDYPET